MSVNIERLVEGDIVRQEENLKRCIAYRMGKCLYGCDVMADDFYQPEEALQDNNFNYYLVKKECNTLNSVRKEGEYDNE